MKLQVYESDKHEIIPTFILPFRYCRNSGFAVDEL